VHKLEELGIGRPSTYAPTISTIQNKEYAEKRDLEGKKRNYQTLVLKDNQITETTETETYGADRKKLVPTDTAIVVNEFLTEYFPDILDYNFTAKIENKFDDVAEGNMKWEDMIDDFYHNFHPLVEDASQISERKNGMRKLGVDPVSGKEVFVKIARFGAIAQIGATEDEEKPRFASLRKNQHLETITLEEALDLFKLPRTVGTYEDSELVVAVGRFGPYIKHNGQAYSLAKTYDPLTVTNEECIKIIEAKREEQKNKVINKFDDNGVEIEVLNGRFGPYIAKDGVNYKIAKGTDAKALTLDDCRKIIAEQADKAPAKKAKATKTAKASTKTAAKTKASTKKSAEK
jgi:DNA topoisomerase-1